MQSERFSTAPPSQGVSAPGYTREHTPSTPQLSGLCMQLNNGVSQVRVLDVLKSKETIKAMGE